MSLDSEESVYFVWLIKSISEVQSTKNTKKIASQRSNETMKRGSN